MLFRSRGSDISQRQFVTACEKLQFGPDPQDFDRLKADWEDWNAKMLAQHPRPVTYTNAGNLVADHYGVTNPPPAEFGGGATAAPKRGE